MKIDALREYCLAFPRATEKLQWGDELCFKIASRIFLMLGLDNPRLCF
jgi:predicted DNA-binding protein (MmcQ/YjbR family)